MRSVLMTVRRVLSGEDPKRFHHDDVKLWYKLVKQAENVLHQYRQMLQGLYVLRDAKGLQRLIERLHWHFNRMDLMCLQSNLQSIKLHMSLFMHAV